MQFGKKEIKEIGKIEGGNVDLEKRFFGKLNISGIQIWGNVRKPVGKKKLLLYILWDYWNYYL